MFNPWVGQIPWRRKWQPTPVFLPGKSHGQRSLAGCSLWGHTESVTTEPAQQLHCLTHLYPQRSLQFFLPLIPSTFLQPPWPPAWVFSMLGTRLLAFAQAVVYQNAPPPDYHRLSSLSPSLFEYYLCEACIDGPQSS